MYSLNVQGLRVKVFVARCVLCVVCCVLCVACRLLFLIVCLCFRARVRETIEKRIGCLFVCGLVCLFAQK